MSCVDPQLKFALLTSDASATQSTAPKNINAIPTHLIAISS